MSAQALQRRIAAGEIILLDGATGTELERLGAKMDSVAWCALANKTSPDLVRTVHENYIRAGADVITANTFGTARHVLTSCDLADEVTAINLRAVELALAARDAVADHDVWVAGSLSSMPPFSEIDSLPMGDQARSNYVEQAELLAQAGVDLLICEMMTYSDNAALVVTAAVQTGLPVWVGFSAQLDAAGMPVPWGDKPAVGAERRGKLEQTIETVLAIGADVLGIMHTTVADTAPALELLRRFWSGPTMAYAESGSWEPPNWSYEGVISENDYLNAAEDWLARGVQIIGGCCGIGPAHIRRLRERLPGRPGAGAPAPSSGSA